MSASILKCIAMISMLIDHVGVVFSPWLEPEVYTMLRALGRTAFPLYAFMLVEGAVHTKNAPKYLLRLVIFSLISEVPFDFAFYSRTGSLLYWQHQNVFITLSIGLAAIILLEKVRKSTINLGLQNLLVGVIALLACLLVDFTYGDYGYLGVALILFLYFLKAFPRIAPLVILLWLAYYDWSTGFVMELYGIPAALLIVFYNGRKGGSHLPKWFFYGFYPAHLLFLACLRQILMR